MKKQSTLFGIKFKKREVKIIIKKILKRTEDKIIFCDQNNKKHIYSSWSTDYLFGMELLQSIKEGDIFLIVLSEQIVSINWKQKKEKN